MTHTVTVLGEGLITPRKGDRPVDQEQVNIVGAKLTEGGIQCLFDVIWVVLGVPEFRGEEDALARDARLFNSLANSGFRPVARCFSRQQQQRERMGKNLISPRTSERCQCACSQL